MPQDRDPNWNPIEVRRKSSQELRTMSRYMNQLPEYQRKVILEALRDAEKREAAEAEARREERERRALAATERQAISAEEANDIAKRALYRATWANAIAGLAALLALAALIAPFLRTQ